MSSSTVLSLQFTFRGTSFTVANKAPGVVSNNCTSDGPFFSTTAGQGAWTWASGSATALYQGQPILTMSTGGTQCNQCVGSKK